MHPVIVGPPPPVVVGIRPIPPPPPVIIGRPYGYGYGPRIYDDDVVCCCKIF